MRVAALLAVMGGAIGQAQNPSRPWRPPVPGHADENPQFFPTGTFGSNGARLAGKLSWYLRSMAERPLPESVSPEQPQIYRLLVEMPPPNSPVVVRLSIGTGGTGEVVTKIGQSPGHPDVLTVNRTIEASPAAVDHFLNLLENAGFWSMPTCKPFDIHHVLMGGTDYVLEGSQGNRYHVVERKDLELVPLNDSVVALLVTLAKVELPGQPTRK